MKLQPPAAPSNSGFQGSKFGESMDAGTAAAKPFVQETEALKQMGQDEETKAKAIAYRKLLHSGADGMKQYAAEVGNEFPDLGQQLGQEAEQYGTFLQDPNLTPDQAEEYAHHFYDSANNRLKARKEPKAEPAAKPWAPGTQQEAEDWYRFKKETDADSAPPKPGAPGSAADRARAEKRMQALRKLPAMWKQIEEMQATGGTVPLIPGKAEPDVRAYMENQAKPWREKWDSLRKDLNRFETDAGLEASTDIMGPGRDNSASYKLYKGNGSGTQAGGTKTSAPSPARPNKSATAIDGAVQWLKDVKSGKIKDKKNQREAILAEVKKAGVSTDGL